MPSFSERQPLHAPLALGVGIGVAGAALVTYLTRQVTAKGPTAATAAGSHHNPGVSVGPAVMTTTAAAAKPAPSSSSDVDAAVTASVTGESADGNFATRCAQHRWPHAASLKGVAPPIVLSSTYCLEDADHSSRLAEKPESSEADADGFFYSRWVPKRTRLFRSFLESFVACFVAVTLHLPL